MITSISKVPERCVNSLGRDTGDDPMPNQYTGPGPIKLCSIDGCGGIARARGLCNKHYLRLRNNGTTAYMRDELAARRTMRLVQVSPLTGCWLWMGRVNGTGYGPHRRFYERKYGKLAPGRVLDHLCRTRRCVNADHMEPVAHQENVLRGMKGRMVTHCPKGHPYDEANTVLHHGRRECLTCRRDRDKGRRDATYWREYRARRNASA